MQLTVTQIAELVKGRLHGDGARSITGAAGLVEATSSDVSFLRDAKNAAAVKSVEGTKAGAIIVPKGFDANGHVAIEVDNPIAAFAAVLNVIAGEKRKKGNGKIHASAVVSPSAKVGKNATIGAFCVIEDGAEVGENATLVSHVYIGERSKVGRDSYLYPQVTLREEVSVGERCILHAGAVIGSDGYGFYFEGGKHNKIHQIGTVIVEDDVEIGSCTTIDRATTGATIIRKGAKIDNLVQIAHNVEVGSHALLVAQVGIAGSTKIGKGVVLAGQVGVADHVTIGDGTQVGAQSGIRENVAPGSVLFGTPAQPIQDTLKQLLLLRRLPDLFKDVKSLKEKK